MKRAVSDPFSFFLRVMSFSSVSCEKKTLDVARARKARIPGTVRRARQGPPGRPGHRSRWPMVQRGGHVPVQPRHCQARDAPLALGGSVRAAWLRRWQGMLGCAAARAFAESLLEGPATGGVDGPTLSTNDVLGDACFG